MMFSRRSVLITALAVLWSNPTPAEDYVQNALCVDGKDAICATLPTNLPGLVVNAGYSPNTDAMPPGDTLGQINFDYFAWQMFVALNWPAGSSGTIISDTSSPRVWEGYKTVAEVYPGQSGETCDSNARLRVSQTSKLTSSSFIEPFTPYPLIDSAGNFVVYDVRLNDVEAEYIVSNNLQTLDGQKAFGKAWSFPAGTGTAGNPGEPGAIELKTAWRVFPAGADTTGFFTVPGLVEVDAAHSATGKPLCLDVTLGLVGMHIMQKISDPADFSEFWVWATFEHALNAPLSPDATVSQMNEASTAKGNDPVSACTVPAELSGSWSFFNRACTADGAACPANAPPPKSGNDYVWEPSPPFAERHLSDGKFGTQAVRCWAVYDTAKSVDKAFQGALAGSVWANYRLVGAQWAQAAIVEYQDPLQPFPAPIYLTNTTLETYLQIEPVIDPKTGHPNHGPSGSCITCHALAKDRAGNDSNFSFLSGYAQ